ncbi:MAG: hypothetical protein DI533_16940 [Cereibacter sphaeroides]|uniref:DUF3618 domain-containing protein n=1 Tax=Cereibacter sphaeroides TaxID=1063 RepID=A0A2W5TK97_CERSP|nr:MAG: hypothetical protein DI533_16940 [Cereibacter sphaeroides]
MWLLSGIRNPSRSVEDDRATSDPEWLKKKAPDDAASNTSVLSTKRIAAKLAAGTQDLSDEARRHVMEAREKAYHAREAVTRKLKQTQHKASNMFEEQPLLIGALAVALGSAIANAVPRTQVEDRALGDASDRLIAEAQAIFRNEQAQAGTQL